MHISQVHGLVAYITAAAFNNITNSSTLHIPYLFIDNYVSKCKHIFKLTSALIYLYHNSRKQKYYFSYN